MKAIMVKTVGDPALAGALAGSAINVQYGKEMEHISEGWRELERERIRQGMAADMAAERGTLEAEVLRLRAELARADATIKQQKSTIHDLREKRLQGYYRQMHKKSFVTRVIDLINRFVVYEEVQK